ncbi:MAG: hypothetical protein H7Z43_03405 [Clostridia bacterium]|nr:hypothetical protein [Deltaproteobacteria bacterium]
MAFIRGKVGRLLDSGQPTTFLDALKLTVNRGQLADDEIDLLIALYDGPNTTDGAKEVLASLLRMHAKMRAGQRDDGAKTLTVDDSGKTVRTPAGTPVNLSLATRAHLGGAWKESVVAEGITFATRGLDRERRYTHATLVATEPGTHTIKLEEVLALPVRSQARSQAGRYDPKRFELTLIIEQASSSTV